MVWLGGLTDYEQVEEVLEQVGQVHVSDSSVWRQEQVWGVRFQAEYDKERLCDTVVRGRWGGPCRQLEVRGRMGVAMDGTKVHLREEGWKELKVGSVFAVEERRARDERTGDWIEVAHAVQNSYVAHLGGPEQYGQLVWWEAVRRGWQQAADTQVVGDGAPWIWNLAVDHFYDSWQVVDWYHAKEHLAHAAQLLKGEETPEAQRWLHAHETTLYTGTVFHIVQELERAAQQHPKLAQELRTEAGYFRNNERRMNYQLLREDGWVVGSGMVESAGKQFKARFGGPGMRWSRPGAEHLIPVRAAVLSRRFEELWRTAYNSPPN